MSQRTRNWIALIASIILIAVFLRFVSQYSTQPKEISRDEYAELVKKDEVTSTSIAGTLVSVTLKNNQRVQFSIGDSERVEDILKDRKVEDLSKAHIDRKKDSNAGLWLTIAINILPIVLIAGFIFLMMRQAQGSSNQALSFGRSRARLFNPEKKKTLFSDVAGLDEAKDELEEIVEFLKSPQKFSSLGARIPKGVLLVGAPGTGKTLLAKAVAGEAGVPFFSISGSEFVEMFVGVGAARVRDLFTRAKKNAPCIVFIDEIDAVGRQRGAGLGGSHDEREQTLNQILVEMDGFDTETHVIIMAATNRPDILDQALLRPGRFDRRVVLDLPDVLAREAVLAVHSRGKPLGPDIDLKKIAQRTPGFSGADLANLVNEAAILAARRNLKRITQEEFYDSVEKVLLGPERKAHILSDKEKLITAFHEAGHAIVSHILPRTHPVRKISIVSRGMAGGYTWSIPDEDKHLYAKSDFNDMIAQMLGGRAAEQIVFNDITTGAENDLQQATKLARKMVMEFGMAEADALKNRVFGHKEELVFLGRELTEQRNYSEGIAGQIDEEVNRIIDRAYESAVQTLQKYRKQLDTIAKALMQKETIDEDEFVKLLKGLKKGQPEAVKPPFKLPRKKVAA